MAFRPIRIPEKRSVPDSVTSTVIPLLRASKEEEEEEEEKEKRDEGEGEIPGWLVGWLAGWLRAYAFRVSPRVGVRESACSHVHNRVLYWACVIAPLSLYYAS